jgi:hypothetical protein
LIRVFWTVNFSRPAMAFGRYHTAPDALRVDAVFQKADDLIGLIWESQDKWDHPLLAYETKTDYSRLTLSFRWRSAGVLPLDAVNGPTLTIERARCGGQCAGVVCAAVELRDRDADRRASDAAVFGIERRVHAARVRPIRCIRRILTGCSSRWWHRDMAEALRPLRKR